MGVALKKAKIASIARFYSLIDNIKSGFARWREIWTFGTTDPFHEDGVNLNLTRSHILSNQEEMRDLCAILEFPEPAITSLKAPPEMPWDWMAPNSKAGHALKRAEPGTWSPPEVAPAQRPARKARAKKRPKKKTRRR